MSELESSSKRTFLKGSAAVAAAALMPRSTYAADTWDVIVVGGGTAGMPTAYFAAMRGLKTLLIDKYHKLGGTLDRSGGQIAAAGTKFQKLLGIVDTPDEHYADILRINKGTGDPALGRLFVDNAAATVDWLFDNGFKAAEGHPVAGSGHEFFLKRRYQWGSKNGVSIYETMQPLIDQTVSRGKLQVMLNTGVTELLQGANGAIQGVKTEDASGTRSELRAKSVVLTSGGSASNPVMFQDHHGVPLFAKIAHPMSQGHGLTMGLGVGGYLRGGDKYLCSFGAVLRDRAYPSPIDTGAVLQPHQRMPWEIFVNASGQRFVREDHASVDHREKALLAQPGHRCFVVFDQAILDKAPPLIPGWPREKLMAAFNQHAMFTTAPTLSELGARIMVDIGLFEKSVNDYNAAQQTGSDQFGRNHMPLPIAQGPYYAVGVQGFTIKSSAGLAINPSLQVIRPNGQPIPNLYAAGEVIGGGATSGSSFVNGMMVTPALTFGRLLGSKILMRNA